MSGAIRVYEYHSLFRGFLLSQAESLLSPPEILRIRRAAAEILEDFGHPGDAAALLRATSEWERLTGLIRRHAHPFSSRGGIGLGGMARRPPKAS